MSVHFVEYLLKSRQNLQPISVLNEGLFEGKFSEAFKIRYTAIQNWFLRASFHNKFKYMKSLYDIMNVEAHIKSWYKFLSERSFQKLRGYTNLYNPLDNVPCDHDRTMDSKELEKTIKADLDWFKNFDDDLQFNMFITLLQLGGSPLTEKMSIYIREQASKLMIMMDNQSDDNIKILNESKLSSGTGCFMYTQYCQSNDPSFVIVQKKQKEWADLMMKYRKEVEAKVGKGAAKEKGKKGKKGKKEKKGKKGKKEKVGKKSKKSKKSKSKKGKKEKNTSDIDYVQVMPINVVKKILSFLDKKTLGIVSKVNEYWKYAVSSLNEDMKARKMLDKLMETHRVETRLVDPKLSTKIFNKSRVDRLWREIASSKQIKNSLKVSKKERSDYTLLQKAVQEIPEEYILPVYNLSSFSRKVPQDEDTNLYESPAKIRHELGYKQKPTTDELDPVGMIQMIRKKSIAQMQEEYIKNFDDDDDDDLIPADACPSSLFIPYQSGMSNF